MTKKQIKEKILNYYKSFEEFYKNNAKMFYSTNLKCYNAFYYLSDAKKDYNLLDDSDIEYIWNDFCDTEYRYFEELYDMNLLVYLGSTSSFYLVPETLKKEINYYQDYKSPSCFALACFDAFSNSGYHDTPEELFDELNNKTKDELEEILFYLNDTDIEYIYSECIDIFNYLQHFKENQVEIIKSYCEMVQEDKEREKEEEEKARQEEEEKQNKINKLFYFLAHTNKNYTKKQYYAILELAELLNINV